MRFLIDEMFGPEVASCLGALGHDAVHVRELGMGGAPDDDVLARAVAEGRIVVTENAADFLILLEQRTAAGLPVTPVVVAPKRHLPRSAGALAPALAERLARWAEDHPAPYRHAHWLG